MDKEEYIKFKAFEREMKISLYDEEIAEDEDNLTYLLEDENGNIYTAICDEELDPYRINFNNDGCVQIITEGYAHITLDKAKLNLLIELIDEAEEMYNYTPNKDV